MTDIARLSIEVDSRGIAAARKELERLRRTGEDSLVNIDRQTKRTQSNFSRLRSSVLSLQGAFAALGGAFAVREVVQSSIELTRINNALKIATGSTAEAAEEFEFIRQESDRLGLSLRTTAREYAALAAASRGTGVEGDTTREIFIGVSEAATVLGLSAEQTGGALTAIQQIISKGTVSAEELRGQLGERLPGAFQIAARAVGVTTKELGEMLQRGEVLADDFLPKFARELRKTFSNDAEDAANGLQQEINRLSTAFFNITSSGDVDGLAESVGDLADNLNDPQVKQGIQTLIQGIVDLSSFAATAITKFSELGVAIGETFAEAVAGPGGRSVESLKEEIIDLNRQILAGGTQVAGIPVGVATLEERRDQLLSQLELVSELSRITPNEVPEQPPTEEDQGGGGGGGRSRTRVPQIEREIEALQRQISLFGELTNAERARISIAEGFLGTVGPAQERQLIALAEELDAKEATAEATERQIELEKELAEEKNRILDQIEEFEAQLLSEEQALEESYRRRIEIIQGAAMDRVITDQRASDLIAGQRAKQEEELAELAERGSDEMSEFAIQAARNIESAFADFLFDPFNEGLDGLLSNFADILQRMAAEAAAAEILEGIGGAFSGGGQSGSGGSGDFLSTAASAIGSFFGGARERGGPVDPSRAFLVGEKGPELFVPRVSGNIIPNSQDSNQPMNVNVRVITRDPETKVQVSRATEARSRGRQLQNDRRYA